MVREEKNIPIHKDTEKRERQAWEVIERERQRR